MSKLPNYIPVLPGMTEEEIHLLEGVGYWVGSVNPSRASQWLATFNDPSNPELIERPILKASIEALKAQMKGKEGRKSRWEKDVPDHLAVTRGKHPFFINGVSRLIALSESDKPIKLRIMLGVNPNIFLFTDTGRTTTPAGALKAIYPNTLYPQTLAGAIRFVMNYRAGRMIEMVRPQRFVISLDEIIEFHDQNPLLQEFTTEAHKLYRESERLDQLVTPRVIAGLMFIAINDCKQPAQRTKEYFRKLLLPTTQDEADDLSTTIRRTFGSEKMGEMIARLYLEKVGQLIKGYNAFMKFRKGESKMISLKVNVNQFPRIEEAPRDIIKELA